MATTRTNFPFDDSLIISRWQQKELSPYKPGYSRLSHLMSPLGTLKLDPFIDQLPIKIGLNLNLLGMRIVSLEIERGFLAQGLEKSLATFDFRQGLMTALRLNQRTPIFAQLAYTFAFEQLLKIEVANELKEMRCLLMEYSRIFHHWHVIKDTLITIGQFGVADMAKEAIATMKASHDLLCRIYNQNNHTKAAVKLSELNNILLDMNYGAKEVENAITFDQSIRQLRKKAVVTQSVASSYGLTGLFLRANRNLYDLRLQNPSLGYTHAPTTELAEGGDAWARLCIRIREIISSIEWIKKSSLLQQDHRKNIETLKDDRLLNIADAKAPFAFGEVDAPEGNLKFSIFIDSQKKPKFFIRTPAYFIAQALPHLLAQSDLKDLPTILYSLGINAEEIDK